MSILRVLTRLLDPLTKIQWGIERTEPSSSFLYSIQEHEVNAWILKKQIKRDCVDLLRKHGLDESIVK